VKLFTRELPTDADQQRERHAEQTRQIMASGKEELSRADLDFEALGGRMVEHGPTGAFFNVYAGDPQHVGSDVTAFFVTDAGEAILLQRASVASRDELAQKRAKRDARRAAREAEHARRRNELRRQAGR